MAKKRKRTTKRVQKRKLVGFTKTQGKYRLVFKKGAKLSLGTKKFGTKKTLLAAAKKRRR